MISAAGVRAGDAEGRIDVANMASSVAAKQAELQQLQQLQASSAALVDHLRVVAKELGSMATTSAGSVRAVPAVPAVRGPTLCVMPVMKDVVSNWQQVFETAATASATRHPLVMIPLPNTETDAESG